MSEKKYRRSVRCSNDGPYRAAELAKAFIGASDASLLLLRRALVEATAEWAARECPTCDVVLSVEDEEAASEIESRLGGG